MCVGGDSNIPVALSSPPLQNEKVKLTCTDRMPAYLTTVVMMAFMVSVLVPVVLPHDGSKTSALPVRCIRDRGTPPYRIVMLFIHQRMLQMYLDHFN